MRLRGEVDDVVDPLLREEARDEVGVRDVALDEAVAGVPLELALVLAPPRVSEDVEVHEAFDCVGERDPEEGGADETAASRDE